MSREMWLEIGIVVALLGLVGTASWLFFRRSWARKDPSKRRPGYPVELARFWAWLAIAVFAIGGVGRVLTTLFSEQVTIENLPLFNYWPSLPSGMELQPGSEAGAGGALLVEGAIHSADVTVSGIGLSTRLFLAGGELLIALACIAVAVLIHRACTGILRGTPFTPGLRLWAWWTAMVVLVAGFAGQILRYMGQSQAGDEALPRWTVADDASPELRKALGATASSEVATPRAPSFGGGDITFTPLFTAMIIIVVVELLSAGVNLAARNARLAKDVEGLV